MSVERPLLAESAALPDIPGASLPSTAPAAGSAAPAAGAQVPDHALLAILRREALRHGLPAPMRIREHTPWIYEGAEILECVLASGAEWRVMWKRGPSQPADPRDSLGAIAYETKLYEHILGPDGYGPPRFLGAAHQAATDEDWIFEEFLPGAIRLPELSLDIARSAAGWIGQFHRAFERSPMTPSSSFVRRYDEEWYRDRIDRMAGVLEAAGRITPEVEAIVDASRRRLPGLLAGPATLIHGEFSAVNILIHGTAIRPVDWALAAIAPGEVDLATLTEGWGSDEEAALATRYRSARWPSTEPAGFEERFQAARAYSAFRRLGDLDAWTAEADRHLGRLVDAAGRLRLTEGELDPS